MLRISINPWPYAHIAATVIRDDDISYFTPPYKIEQIYDKAWKQGFKVSIGAIPNVRAIDDPLVPPSYRGKLSLHKIHKNENLVKYLKEKLIAHQIDIAQHGYTHEMVNEMPEFSIDDSLKIKAKLEAGRKILEDCLPTRILVFIAPWDSVSKQTWNILKESGLALCGRKGKTHKGQLYILHPIIRALTHGIHVRFLHPSKNRVAKFFNMIELHHSFDWWSKKHQSYIFNEERVKEAREEFEKVLVAGDMFCLVNHYYAYYTDWQDDINLGKLDCFYSVLDFLDRRNVWKTTLSEIVRWIKKLEKIKVYVNKEKMVLNSSTTVRGLTIKGEGCIITPASDADIIVRKEKDDTFVVYKKLEPGETQVAFIESY